MERIIQILIENAEFSVGIAGFVLAVASMLLPTQKKAQQLIAIVVLVLCYFPIAAALKNWDQKVVPNVVNMTFANAQTVLRDKGFLEQAYTNSGAQLSNYMDMIVVRQEPAANETAEEGSTIILYFTEVPGDFVSDNSDTSSNELAIEIVDYYYFYDGYRKEWQDETDPTKTSFVEFEKGQQGIYGTFSYSRELSQYELKEWYHSGKLLDSLGNDLSDQYDTLEFWSNSEGSYAVKLPEDIPSGHYCYVLELTVGTHRVWDTIVFEVE